MTINISTDISLPKNAVTQKLAFLGISGSGKTYAARTLGLIEYPDRGHARARSILFL